MPPHLLFPSPSAGAPAKSCLLVLDLGAVERLTAAGLGELVTLHRRVRASGGRLVLSGVGERAHEVLRLARLTDLLEVRRRRPPDGEPITGPA